MLGYVLDGIVRGLGELSPLQGAAERSAELALTVEPEFRARGIGTLVGRHIINTARNRLIARVHVACLRSNVAMVRVAGRLGARLMFDADDAQGALALPPPDGLSLLVEGLDDAASGASLVHRLSAGQHAGPRLDVLPG